MFATFLCYRVVPEMMWTVETVGKDFTADEETPDEVTYWLGFSEGQEKRTSTYSLSFTENSGGELEVSGEEVLTVPLGDPLAAVLRHGGVTSDWSNFVWAMACSVHTPASGWTYPQAPRITVRDDQVIASFPIPRTTLDLTDATSIGFYCGYDSSGRNTPPIGRRDFDFTAEGYSFTGIHEVNPYVQEPHSVKVRTHEPDAGFHIYLAPDGSGAALATDEKPEPEDALRNELALVLAAAGIGLLLARSRFPRLPVGVSVAVTGISTTTGFVLATSDSSRLRDGTPGTFLIDFSFAWWSLLLPALLVIAVTRHRDNQGLPPLPHLLRYGTVAPFAAVVLAVLAVLVRYADRVHGPWLVAIGFVAVAQLAWASEMLGRGPWVGAGLGSLLFTGLWLAPLLEAPLPVGPTFALVAGCSLSWAAALTFCARGLGDWRIGALALTAFCAVLCLFPASKYLTWSGDDALFRAVADATASSVAYGLIELAALAAAAACATVVLRRGAEADAMRDGDVRLCGVLLVGLSISPLMANVSFMASDVIACVLGVITFWFLLPRTKAEFAYRLSRLSPGAYVRLMHAEARNRLHRQAWMGFHKSAHSSLSTEETGAREFEMKWRDFAERPIPLRNKHFVSTNPALASSAARTPRQNALETGILGLVFATPVIVIDLRSWESVFPAVSLTELTMLALHILRWAVYAAFYGYFYPRLPGQVPVAKSTFFLLAVLLPELTLIPLSAPYSTRETLTVLLLRTGEIIVFCYGLGLSWEIRLARLAGLPWSGLRDLRRLSTITAPAATVIVAMATTVATALAGAATVAMLQSGPANPEAPAVPQSPSPASPTVTP
ncbi:hypothetical protein ACWD3I_29955 [Streptomyces sp. NPDC002817]|uniref:hypothetical protein n=1 Tax=Streptomyces sp. NPDC088357 TaxID=3154655 RepID=UPI003434175A